MAVTSGISFMDNVLFLEPGGGKRYLFLLLGLRILKQVKTHKKLHQ